jgi:hypothetical protein
MWSENLHKAARTFGKNMRTVRTWPDRLKQAGFQNVQTIAIPVLPLFFSFFFLFFSVGSANR